MPQTTFGFRQADEYDHDCDHGDDCDFDYGFDYDRTDAPRGPAALMAVNRAESGSGPRALFPQGPSLEEKDFSTKEFIVRDFVDELAESAIPVNRRSAPATQPAFDPKPLIRTFENALSQLGALTEKLEEEESGLQSDVRRAEMQHDRTLETLGRKLDQSMAQFEALDSTLNSSNGINGHDRTARGDIGGNVAVQIGERLEELDRKRRRALDANFLIQCWNEVSETGQLGSLEEMKRVGGAENKVRCANIARQLMRISQRLDPTSWGQTNGYRRNGITNGVTGISRKHNTREVLEKFCEVLEQDLLEQFNRSYRSQNFPDMLQCAKVLFDFNGGNSVVATFVNQHDFFINRNQLLADEVTGDDETWELLADPDKEPPGIEQSLQSLIDEVRVVMQEESFIIKQAFPMAETVLIKFIQRVFQQSVQQRLEMVLEKADSVSSLAFLRSLHSARTYIGQLIEDLKTHGLIDNPEPCSAHITNPGPADGGAYTIFHSRRKKAPSGFMAAIAQQGSQLLASAKDVYLERLESSDLTPTQKAMMLRVAGVKDNSENKNEIEVSEEDGAISVEVAQRMMQWLAESVRRTLELGSSTDTARDVNSLLSLLLTSMGQVYIETALDAALDASSSQENSKVEPDISYLPNIRPAVTIANIMSRFIHTVMIRLAEGNATVRRSMEAQGKMAMETIERKTNSVVKSSVDVVINWVTRTLATQRKTDFRPKDAELELIAELLQTPTCQTICSFLKRVSILSTQAIDGHNLEIFSSELALAIHKLLLEHFKKFSVNATGGLMVTKDLNKYISTLKEWPLTKEVQGILDLLPEIGYLFIIGPEALKEKSRNLGSGSAATGKKLTKADFKAIVQKREDSSSVGIQSVLNGL
ncbi:hypothetical protein INS49_008321 [Diaporthe citri]|uniref:uncharacterized protein n=1 Tax=Diaporthe citri TaxID=83186 RepID=UPI001C80C415|nr:uncharacterized protein INS49_008321 [Diaporthe citri]KAG6363225.1 hypothetical protein INS49_008321 [Diaporthe citri]